MSRFFAFPLVALVLLAPVSNIQADETYIVLSDGSTELRDAFNEAEGTVRLLFVVDPICPGCLRNLDDINEALLSTTDDPRLRTFVVYVPVLGPEEKDVGPAADLVENSHAQHYWNPSGAFGWELTKVAGLADDDGEPVYAWDVWAIYGPEANWNGALPPKPQRLMHNLWALDGNTEIPRFDAEVFAQEARELLSELPGAQEVP